MRRHSWERISQLFKVLSRIMQVLPWNRCLTSQHKWSTMRKKFLVWTIHWEKYSWKRLSLISDETVINLQSTKVFVFPDSVLCLGRVLQHPDSNEAWKNRIAGIQSGRSCRDYDGVNGESTDFEWNIFPGFTTLQLCGKINDLLSDLGQKPESFTGRILFMSMFNHIFCDRYDNKDECLRNANIVKTFAGRFGIGQWSFIGPGSEKNCYSAKNSPQGAWDNIAEEMLLEFAESGHPTFRATTRLSRGQLKNKGRGKLSIHFAADEFTIETFFALSFLSISSVSTEQWQLYVKNLRAIKIDRVNLRFAIKCSWRSQSRSSFCKTKITWMTKLYGSSTVNELNRFHQKVKWVDSVGSRIYACCWSWTISRDQGHWKLETISFSGLSRIHSYLETIQLQKQKDGFKETWE